MSRIRGSIRMPRLSHRGLEAPVCRSVSWVLQILQQQVVAILTRGPEALSTLFSTLLHRFLWSQRHTRSLSPQRQHRQGEQPTSCTMRPNDPRQYTTAARNSHQLRRPTKHSSIPVTRAGFSQRVSLLGSLTHQVLRRGILEYLPMLLCQLKRQAFVLHIPMFRGGGSIRQARL